MEAAQLKPPAWNRDALAASPIHASVAREIAALPGTRFPVLGDLNELLAARPPIQSGGGARLHFVVPPPASAAGARYYEIAIHETGGVPTRPDNWHDLFNALAWLAFPQTKRALNAAHVAEIRRRGGERTVRGPVRDALSLFDEGGILVACADPALAALLAARAWRTLFVARRDGVRRDMQCHVLGHAILEKAVAPYPGVTAKALVLEVPRELLAAPLAERIAHLDRLAEAFVTANAATLAPRALGPLPVLGVPGWHAPNEDPVFYDDTDVFRPPPAL